MKFYEKSVQNWLTDGNGQKLICKINAKQHKESVVHRELGKVNIKYTHVKNVLVRKIFLMQASEYQKINETKVGSNVICIRT